MVYHSFCLGLLLLALKIIRSIAGNSHELVMKNTPSCASTKCLQIRIKEILKTSVADPEPQDPYVFEPPGSGSSSTEYGSGSFYNQAKIVRKTLIPTILWFLYNFLS
jgi:hypothetical protein